jgi:predicted  nucleic acid-binding Zn-ribbon protein
MHEDLLAVHDLLKVENEMMDLRKEAAALASRVKKARMRIQKTEQQQAAEEAALSAIEDEERNHNRRIRECGARKDRTQKLIDSGSGNYHSALAQLEELKGMIDRMESELLETIDKRERQEACIERTKELLVVAKGRAVTAAESQRMRRPEVEARYKVLAPLRKARTSSIDGHLGQRYADLRARQRPVLVRAVDGTCEFCHMSVPAHILAEIWGGKRVHTCRGCGCWFRDAVETEPDAPEEAAD